MADMDFTHNARVNGFKLYCNFDAVIYSFPDESGDAKNKLKRSFKGYYRHLFDITGGGKPSQFFSLHP